MLAFACLTLSATLGWVVPVTVSIPLDGSMVPATDVNEIYEIFIPSDEITERKSG